MESEGVVFSCRCRAEPRGTWEVVCGTPTPLLGRCGAWAQRQAPTAEGASPSSPPRPLPVLASPPRCQR